MPPPRFLRASVCPWLALAFLACGCAPAETPAGSDPPWFEEIAGHAGIDFVYKSGHGERFFLPEIMGGGAALFDMDGDGYLDLFLVQSGNLFDRSASGNHQLFRNRGDGTFENVTTASRVGVRGYGMGVAAGDFDNDGHVDLYITNFGPNVLLKNDGHGRFTDVTAKTGVAGSGWSTSAAFVDYDGDGWLDLFVANDSTPNHLWLNQGGGTFREAGLLTGRSVEVLPSTRSLARKSPL